MRGRGNPCLLSIKQLVYFIVEFSKAGPSQTSRSKFIIVLIQFRRSTFISGQNTTTTTNTVPQPWSSVPVNDQFWDGSSVPLKIFQLPSLALQYYLTLKLQSFYNLKGLVVSFTVARLSEKAQNSPSKYKISPNVSYEMIKLTVGPVWDNILSVTADFVQTISPPVWVYEYIWQGRALSEILFI